MLPAGGRSARGHDDRAPGALDDPVRDAPEQAREHLAATRAAEHDQLGIEGPRLRKDCLGYPVDCRVTYASAGGEAGHPQFERRSLGDERRLIPGFARVPLITRHLAQPQVQRPDPVTPSVATSFTRPSTAWLWPVPLIATRILANIAPHVAFIAPAGQSAATPSSSRASRANAVKPFGFR